MLGLLVFALFIACGLVQGRRVFSEQARIARLWLGAVLGLMEMLWFPSLFAFRFGFTMPAQLWALASSLALALICALFPRGKRAPDEKGKALSARFALALVIPAAILAGYLQYTHTLREIDGALYSGQSTYGDLCMHLSFATGLIGQSYPPEYTLLPGATLGYPFLVDALSATMILFGTPVSLSFAVPGTVMIFLIDLGFVIFSWELTHRKSATALAFALFLFNGGLGFLQTGASGAGLLNALFGYYQTPTNLPDMNLRWVNALCDLLIPQRTLMAGWMCVIPALYLLTRAMKRRRLRDFVGLGLWAGPMVMIHTHSFLALGAISLGALADRLIRGRGERAKTLLLFGVYGVIACAVACPQLMIWTFPQTLNGGSLKLLFNWVNNDGNGGLIDPYFVFWIKNVGLVYVLIWAAGLSARTRSARALSLGALALYLLAEFVVFQPNVYDNNKLFYVAFLTMLPLAADFAVRLFARLRGLRGRAVLAAFFVAFSVLSGGISIARECVSGAKGYNYQLFSRANTEAAEFIRENTPADAVFLTANHHNNPVASLAGRKIICGSSLYLYFHGLDYRRNEADVCLMLAYPEEYAELFEQYGVDYVFVSSYERNMTGIDPYLISNESHRQDNYAANEAFFSENYPLVYEGGEWYDRIAVYAVSAKAQSFNKLLSQNITCVHVKSIV